MDTWNDGSPRTMKTVLPLHNVVKTGPWTWHGWQTSLDDAMQKSFTKTMQRPGIDPDDAQAVLRYLESLALPPNPFRGDELSDLVQRGKAIFHGERAACASCHSGPHFTDGEVHDVGLGSDEDRYDGFNTPSLLGVYRKVRFLHDGRAKSLEAVLTDAHSPRKVSGKAPLTDDELKALVAYLKSL